MEELAGVVLALLAVGVVANFISNGSQGVKDWLSAKFLGRPPGSGAPGASSTGSATGSPPARRPMDAGARRSPAPHITGTGGLAY